MYCAIDFGTSNSAIAVPDAGDGMTLVELEPGQRTMPTAVFYFVEGPEHDGPPRAFGRAAVAAYVDGLDGRLMRSMKSILGSSLIDQTTDVGGGRGVKYRDIVAGYLRHLKRCAEARAGAPIDRVVLGRPVYFVDDDPVRDAQAEAALAQAAREVGYREVQFQYEPIAAALDYERGVAAEQTVLVDPELWENASEDGKAKLKTAADPSLSPEWPVSISIPDWTTYTKEQIVACKGPGE